MALRFFFMGGAWRNIADKNYERPRENEET